MTLISKVFLLAAVLFTFSSAAQSAKELQETARNYMRQGDFTNAYLVLNKASVLEPKNIEITKDLALNYFFQRKYTQALEEIKPVLDRDEADDQCYQMAANCYKQLDDKKECEKIYKKGIRKFPQSGSLYNDFGEYLWDQKSAEAIKQWEKGIDVDPNFSKNYYNACKYYYSTGGRIWSILYGETFVNMDPLGRTTPEIKSIVLESYKRLFAEGDYDKSTKELGKFADAFLQTMKKQTAVASGGIDPETLTMIRSRFILDWYHDYGSKFPNRLFEYHRQLLQEGMFDAYNQWLFGTVQNLAAYQNWITAHSSDNTEFNRFQRGRMYKIPAGQVYH